MAESGVSPTPADDSSSKSPIRAVKGAVLIEQIQDKNERPTMKDLQRYVITKYATDWYEIGIELGLELNVKIIEKNHPHQCEICFQKTLQKWLESTNDATWKTLEVALTNVNRTKYGYHKSEATEANDVNDNL